VLEPDAVEYAKLYARHARRPAKFPNRTGFVRYRKTTVTGHSELLTSLAGPIAEARYSRTVLRWYLASIATI
jgi:hypothetical protein